MHPEASAPQPGASAPDAVSTPVRVVAALFLLGVVAAAALSIASLRADQNRMPETADVEAVVAEVRDALREGDVVRALPLWFDQARVGLDGVPFAMSRSLDPYDRHRFERLWVLAPTDREERALDDIEAWSGTRPEPVFSQGGFAAWAAPIDDAERVLWDAYTDLEDAEVARRRPDGSLRTCERWNRDGWHCGRYDPFIFVGRVVTEVDDTYRACVSALPPDQGDTWHIVWPDVPLGDQLRVRGGNTLWGVRQARGAPVEMTVFVGDTEVARRSFPIDEVGYPETLVDTSDRSGESAEVRVEVRSDNQVDRFFCFRAQSVADPSPR